MDRRPNILLITADQWRGDCVQSLGHPCVQTPNIDRLAARGVHFTRHFGQASPCSPARASLYTGLYQMNHRVVGNGTPLDARHDTIALAMRRAGYRPTLFGYTDQSVDPRTVPPDSPWLRTYEGILPGFDVAQPLPEDPEPWLAWLRARGVAVPEDFREIFAPASGDNARPTNAPPRFSRDETTTAFLTDAFLDWLGERPDEAPWFAHVSYISPHPPFIVPPPFNTLYDPADGPPFDRLADRDREAAQHPLLAYWQATSGRGSGGVVGARAIADWDEADFRTVRAIYWGMVSEVDRQIGRVLDGLAKSGADRDTVVVLTSDHGEMLGDHWMTGKFGYFDAAYHVPLIVHDPRRTAAAGRRVEALTEAIDVMPTVLELAGAPVPGHLDGRSLAPFLANETPAGWRQAVHWEFDFRDVVHGHAQQALGLDLDSCSLAVHRDARFKYVHFAGLKPLLYDLSEDSGECVDRAGDPAYAGARLDAAEALLSWRARHLDRTLTGIFLTEDGPVDGRTPR